MARLEAAESSRIGSGPTNIGRDVLSRTLIGARLSLLMGIGATVICLLIGVPLGLLAGYQRGRVDEAVMRTMDVLMSFPPILLGLLILSVTPPALVEGDARRRHRLRSARSSASRAA